MITTIPPATAIPFRTYSTPLCPTYDLACGWNDYRAGILDLWKRKSCRRLAFDRYHATLLDAIQEATMEHRRFVLSREMRPDPDNLPFGNFWYILGTEEAAQYIGTLYYPYLQCPELGIFPLETFGDETHGYFKRAHEMTQGVWEQAGCSTGGNIPHTLCDLCRNFIPPNDLYLELEGLLISDKAFCSRECLKAYQVKLQLTPEFTAIRERADEPLTEENLLTRFREQKYVSPWVWRTSSIANGILAEQEEFQERVEGRLKAEDRRALFAAIHPIKRTVVE